MDALKEFQRMIERKQIHEGIHHSRYDSFHLDADESLAIMIFMNKQSAIFDCLTCLRNSNNLNILNSYS